MALSTARIHRVRGRPPLLAAGITSLIHSHSSSLRSLGYVCSSIYLYYTTHRDFSDRLLDHLGLVAGMFEELGITEVIDQATKQNPAMRIVTAGHAVKAMVLNGLGFVNQQLYLVPHFFTHNTLSRLIAPGIQASQLNDDTLGRALDTLYDFGVTALYSLIAATAATRLALTP